MRHNDHNDKSHCLIAPLLPSLGAAPLGLRARLEDLSDDVACLGRLDIPPLLRFHRVMECIHVIAATILQAEQAGLRQQEIATALGTARTTLGLSGLLSRMQKWSLGDPGDVETIEALIAAPEDSSFQDVASCATHVFRASPLAQQFRNRLAFQTRCILRFADHGQRILSLSAGGALDVVDAVALGSIRSSITFNDPASDALMLIENRLGTFGIIHELVRSDALTYAETLPSNRFDLITTGRLLDTTDSRRSQELIRQLWSALVPGGLLIFSSIARPNPYRVILSILGDWQLIERDTMDVRRLIAKTAPPATKPVVVADTSGLAHLVELRKPRHQG
ncbi:class I SAM-dependent methyltransferase [Paracoccus marinaquae]|uniref:Class I SAM-dependent methyltransferase n=1 Tax=Paracoccus marinaquae TaxID=2841926 RepID=A0ABS6AHB6_9RHOB|nr:class I SAM-dependent methyltransferase [Paracoccus marinaquae]MBU3029984.1 class I SAM-dependent methyltransferase [Paracoccus marinaquae]